MKEIDLIFIDIDGTLITNDKLIPPLTRKVLRKIKADGKTKLILISARMPKSLEMLCKDLDIPNNYVAFNGSLTQLDFIDSSKLKNDEKNVLPNSLVASALDCVEDWENSSFNVYTKDEWLTSNLGYWTQREIRSTLLKPDIDNLSAENIDKEIKGKTVYKFLIRSEAKKLESVLANLKKKEIHKNAILTVSQPTLIEITPFGINKGLSVVEISKITKSKPENMMAFGDAENDIAMIEQVKYGYAMANASNRLKEIAYKVVKSNNEEGVANELVQALNLGVE